MLMKHGYLKLTGAFERSAPGLSLVETWNHAVSDVMESALDFMLSIRPSGDFLLSVVRILLIRTSVPLFEGSIHNDLGLSILLPRTKI